MPIEWFCTRSSAVIAEPSRRCRPCNTHSTEVKYRDQFNRRRVDLGELEVAEVPSHQILGRHLELLRSNPNQAHHAGMAPRVQFHAKPQRRDQQFTPDDSCIGLLAAELRTTTASWPSAGRSSGEQVRQHCATRYRRMLDDDAVQYGHGWPSHDRDAVTTPSPSFERPPVSEVALAVYFSPPLQLRSVHVGLLWKQWRERFPHAEDHPPLPPVMAESFTPSPFSVPFQLTRGFQGVRTWFLTDLGDRIVQIQPDRLVLNWRKLDDDSASYPRYDTLRPEFTDLLAELLAFVRSEQIGPGTIHQAEVSFVNPIPVDSVGGDREIEELLEPWTGAYSDGFLPNAEDVAINLRYRVPHPETGVPVGRLYAQTSRAVRQKIGTAASEEVYLLQLFARGAPLDTTTGGALRFLDLAHDWVVRGFASLTTASMHQKWGREGG